MQNHAAGEIFPELIAQPEQVFRVVEVGCGAGFELEAEHPTRPEFDDKIDLATARLQSQMV